MYSTSETLHQTLSIVHPYSSRTTTLIKLLGPTLPQSNNEIICQQCCAAFINRCWFILIPALIGLFLQRAHFLLTEVTTITSPARNLSLLLKQQGVQDIHCVYKQASSSSGYRLKFLITAKKSCVNNWVILYIIRTYVIHLRMHNLLNKPNTNCWS